MRVNVITRFIYYKTCCFTEGFPVRGTCTPKGFEMEFQVVQESKTRFASLSLSDKRFQNSRQQPFSWRSVLIVGGCVASCCLLIKRRG